MYGLLYLAVKYCSKYHVELVPKKTKLLAFTSKSQAKLVEIQKISNPFSLNNLKIDFSPSAEHVGILRSDDESNMPNVLSRFTSHKNALRAVLVWLVLIRATPEGFYGILASKFAPFLPHLAPFFR